MSRKGVIAKRVKTVQTAISRISANRTDRLAEERCSALGQNISVRLKSRPKFETDRPITITQHDPGNIVPRSAKLQTFHATPRTTMPREPGTSLAAAQPVSRTTADASVRAGKERPTSGRETIGQSHPPTTPADHETIRPRPFRLGQPDCPADRPDRPSERRGRPEAVFEAQSAQFKPKAGADLARLGLAASYT
ncbi:unnamed protein product [Microthlaspi erraticum]|uniref:Uncharacterized protein n=1 Tax=Microthlaspi erraticum TaxID=1685480 RepID=A0A6D2KDX4_9BRAS|nr:unnamed protein product [Microthlaspi erraticum]